MCLDRRWKRWYSDEFDKVTSGMRVCMSLHTLRIWWFIARRFIAFSPSDGFSLSVISKVSLNAARTIYKSLCRFLLIDLFLKLLGAIGRPALRAGPRIYSDFHVTSIYRSLDFSILIVVYILLYNYIFMVLWSFNRSSDSYKPYALSPPRILSYSPQARKIPELARKRPGILVPPRVVDARFTLSAATNNRDFKRATEPSASVFTKRFPATVSRVKRLLHRGLG